MKCEPQWWMGRLASACFLIGAAATNVAPATTIVDDSGTARDGKVGGWSSIVARNGAAAISYYCEDDHSGLNGDMYVLRFAWNDGGGWQWTTVDTLGGSDTSMARGTDGLYQIVYATWSGIGWATGSATNWNIGSVPIPPELAAANISMVLDHDSHPHVVYMNFANGGDHSMRYTYFDGAQWIEGGANQGIIGTGLWTPTIGFSNTQLALDSLGTPHVAFAEPGDPINAYGPMKYATLQGGPNGSWQQESLGVLGQDPSLAIGSDDVPRMMFNGDAGIVYAYKSGGTWNFETVVPGEWGSSVAMTLSDTNVPFACFGMTANEDMYVARRDGAGWVVTRIDGDGTPDPHVILGRYGTSLDVDETGAAHVSYQAIDIYGPDFRADLKYEGLITAPPCVVINGSPASQVACPAGSAAFTVDASGTGPLDYLWRKDGQPLVDGPTGSGSSISGAATAHLMVSGVSSADDGSYDCVVSEPCGSATSAAASLTVGDVPTITVPPAPATVCTGATARFSVSASGAGVLGYEWRKDGIVLADGPTGSGAVISGAASASLMIMGVTAAEVGTYDCVVYNDCGRTTSTGAPLVVQTCGRRGDMNCDGTVDFNDINPFVLALSNRQAYEHAFPNCDWSNADVNDDSVVDFADINPFVALFGG